LGYTLVNSWNPVSSQDDHAMILQTRGFLVNLHRFPQRTLSGRYVVAVSPMSRQVAQNEYMARKAPSRKLSSGHGKGKFYNTVTPQRSRYAYNPPKENRIFATPTNASHFQTHRRLHPLFPPQAGSSEGAASVRISDARLFGELVGIGSGPLSWGQTRKKFVGWGAHAKKESPRQLQEANHAALRRP
jgi:hypothetical protein